MTLRKAGLIAVVASDPNYRASLRDLLVNTGYTVVTLADTGQALDAMKASPPDLVVAALSPAHLEGWAVCRLLRSSAHASLNAIPVLIVPADIQGEEAARITADLCGNGILPFSAGRERLLAAGGGTTGPRCPGSAGWQEPAIPIRGILHTLQAGFRQCATRGGRAVRRSIRTLPRGG